jgi:lycopene beta-cyclase
VSTRNFDFIIAGAGCAGLSLLYRILLEPALQHKKILVVDRHQKEEDDRTWCFWEQGEGLFESIVQRSWDRFTVCSDQFSTTPYIAPYRYKMIAGIDFYRCVMQLASGFATVEFSYETIKNMIVKGNEVVVKTQGNEYRCSYVFNSTRLFRPRRSRSQLMHFRGCRVTTTHDSFDIQSPVLMDFRVPRQEGAAFMYLLPLSSREALVEYTLIGSAIMKQGNYLSVIDNYLSEVLGISSYKVTGEESGVLPLDCRYHDRHHRRRIIHIGIAAGCLKPGSGYAFQFIQRQCDELITLLRSNLVPVVKNRWLYGRFRWYDATLLRVVRSRNRSFATMMETLFTQVPAPRILRFLENSTSFREECAIMRHFPPSVFVPAALKELINLK